MISEFKIPKAEDPKLEKYQFQWLCTNGLLGIIFTFGLLYTALKSEKQKGKVMVVWHRFVKHIFFVTLCFYKVI